MSQNTSHAVMAQRHEPDDKLNYFPTPPWATRALCEHLAEWGTPERETVWEPACGEGYMVRPLREYFARVYGSDVHDYGVPEQEAVADFLIDWALPAFAADNQIDWVITNPPFRLAEEFIQRGLQVAREGVAVLVRTVFLEGEGRCERLYTKHPPEWVLPFAERVPMQKGILDPLGSTATSYCWMIFLQGNRVPTPGNEYHPSHFPALKHIPPCRDRLERPDDYPVIETDKTSLPLFESNEAVE